LDLKSIDWKKDIWKIVSIVSIVIIVILVICIIVICAGGKGEGNNTGNKNSKATIKPIDNDDSMRRIRLDEDFSKDGTIEGIENIRWSDAMIRQFDNNMEISIMLNNNSDTEKIDARTLEVALLDKDGKVITTKDVEMAEIPADYGYTSLEFTVENIEPSVVYDVQINAK